MRFEGTQAYVATDDLKIAVNAAITLERPLLVKGEPGTGKTVLALEIAKALGAPLMEWHVKSTTKAMQGLYEYDAVSRLRDSQLGDAHVQDIRNDIKRGKLRNAFVSDERPVPPNKAVRPRTVGLGRADRAPAFVSALTIARRPPARISAPRRSCSSAGRSAWGRHRTHGRDDQCSVCSAPRCGP